MASLREFRVLYPEYDDFDDATVAEAVYSGNPSFSQMRRDEFDRMFFKQPEPPAQPEPAPNLEPEPPPEAPLEAPSTEGVGGFDEGGYAERLVKAGAAGIGDVHVGLVQTWADLQGVDKETITEAEQVAADGGDVKAWLTNRGQRRDFSGVGADTQGFLGLLGMGVGGPAEPSEELNASNEAEIAKLKAAHAKGSEAVATAVDRRGEFEYENPTILEQAVRAGTAMIPSIGAGLITKSPTVALAGIAPHVYGNTLQEGLERGMRTDDARIRALMYTAAEVGTERIPMGILLRAPEKVRNEFLKGVVKASVAEGAQEAAMEVIGEGIDTTINAVTQGGMGEDWENRELGDLLKDTLTAGAVGAILGGGIKIGISGVQIQHTEKSDKPEPDSEGGVEEAQAEIDELVRMANDRGRMEDILDEPTGSPERAEVVIDSVADMADETLGAEAAEATEIEPTPIPDITLPPEPAPEAEPDLADLVPEPTTTPPTPQETLTNLGLPTEAGAVVHRPDGTEGTVQISKAGKPFVSVERDGKKRRMGLKDWAAGPVPKPEPATVPEPMPEPAPAPERTTTPEPIEATQDAAPVQDTPEPIEQPATANLSDQAARSQERLKKRGFEVEEAELVHNPETGQEGFISLDENGLPSVVFDNSDGKEVRRPILSSWQPGPRPEATPEPTTIPETTTEPDPTTTPEAAEVEAEARVPETPQSAKVQERLRNRGFAVEEGEAVHNPKTGEEGFISYDAKGRPTVHFIDALEGTQKRTPAVTRAWQPGPPPESAQDAPPAASTITEPAQATPAPETAEPAPTADVSWMAARTRERLTNRGFAVEEGEVVHNPETGQEGRITINENGLPGVVFENSEGNQVRRPVVSSWEPGPRPQAAVAGVEEGAEVEGAANAPVTPPVASEAAPIQTPTETQESQQADAGEAEISEPAPETPDSVVRTDGPLFSASLNQPGAPKRAQWTAKAGTSRENLEVEGDVEVGDTVAIRTSEAAPAQAHTVTKVVGQSGGKTRVEVAASPPVQTAEDGGTPAMPSAGVRAEVERLVSKASQIGLKINVVDTGTDIPDNVLRDMGMTPRDAPLVQAWFDFENRTVNVVADKMTSPKQIEAAVAHEVVGHLGLHDVVRATGWASIERQYRQMQRANSPEYRAIRREFEARYADPVDLKTEIHEFVAISAERRVQAGPVARWYRSVRDAVVKGLRKLGLKIDMPMAFVDQLLAQSAREVGWTGTTFYGTTERGQPAGLDFTAEPGAADVVINLEAAATRAGPAFAATMRDGGVKIRNNMTAQDAMREFGEALAANLPPGFDPMALAAAELAKRGVWGARTDNMTAKFAAAPAVMETRFRPSLAPSSNWRTVSDRRRVSELRTPGDSLMRKVKRARRKYMESAGLLTKKQHEVVQQRDAHRAADEAQTIRNTATVKKLLTKAYGKSNWLDVADADKERINDALAGDTEALESLPEGAREAAAIMRADLDQFSDRIIARLKAREQFLQTELGEDADTSVALEKTQALIETIERNKGQYLHRSYKAHDIINWPSRVSKAVREAAVKEVEALIVEKGPDGLTAEQARQDALRTVDSMLYEGTAWSKGSPFSNLAEAMLGQKDLGILTQRKELTRPIRDLLGEYRDPLINYLKSTEAMSSYIANDVMLTAMREHGMGTVFFRKGEQPTTETGQPVVPITPGNVETAGYAPLSGLYTYAEIKEGLREFVEPAASNAVMDTLRTLNYTVKVGKTIGSPTTQARNYVSSIMFVVQSGLFRNIFTGEGAKMASAHFKDIGSVNSHKFRQKMILLGVSGDSIHMGELKAMLKDARTGPLMAAAMGGRKSMRKFMSVASNFKYAQRLYSFGDDFWRVAMFSGYSRILREAHPNATEAEIEAEAAERTRNTYPTYSMIPLLARMFRRSPFLGSFVSFPVESMRVAYWSARYLVNDMKTPGMQKHAMARLGGMTIAYGMAHLIAMQMLDYFALTDEDEESLRRLSPEWQHNSVLIPFAVEDGNVEVWDSTHHNPWAWQSKLLVAAMRGELTVGQRAMEAAKEAAGPFGLEITLGLMADIFENKTDTGRRIVNPDHPAIAQTLDRIAYFGRGILPGAVANAEELWKSSTGQRRWNEQPYNMDDAVNALYGVRTSRIHLPTALMTASRDFNEHKSLAKDSLSRAIYAPSTSSLGSPAAIEEAFAEYVDMHYRAFTNHIALADATMRFGLPEDKAVLAMKSGGMGKRDIGFTIEGMVSPVIFTKQSISPTFLRHEVFGTDAAGRQVTEDRWNQILGLADEWNTMLYQNDFVLD